MYTNTMRYTGTSGIDVQGMVEQLMTAESLKLNKVYQQKQILTWKQESMRSIGNNVKKFQSNFLSFTNPNAIVNMRSASAYSTKTATVTGGLNTASEITIKPGTGASNGTSTVKVTQTATNETYKGSKVEGSIEGKAPIDYDQIKEGDSFSMKYNGTSAKFTFTQEDVDKLSASTDKAADLQAIVQSKVDEKFGTYNGASKVEVKIDGSDMMTIKPQAGTGGEVSFNVGTSTKNTAAILNLKADADGKMLTDSTMYRFTVDGKAIEFEAGKDTPGMDTKDAILGKLQEELTNAGITDVTASLDKNNNIIFTSEFDGESHGIKVEAQIMVDGEPEWKTGFDGPLTGSNKIQNFGIESYQASTSFNTGQTMAQAFGMSGTQTVEINGKEISFNADLVSIDSFMSQVNTSGAGVKLDYNKVDKTFNLTSTTSGAGGAIKLGGGDTNSVLSSMGIDPSVATVVGRDSIIEVNGEQVVRDSNVINYNDTTFTITDASVGNTYSSTVASESKETVNNIVKFVEGYNAMIDELQNATNTNRKKSGTYSYYEPLTEDQRSAMSESDVKKYEEAAKTGILYRDEHLRKLTDSLRRDLNTPVTLSDGSKVTLSSMGITTGSYQDGAKLTIDMEKLTKFAEENGDKLQEAFTKTDTGFMDRINTSIDKAVGTKGYISQYAGFEGSVLVNENTLSRQISSKDNELSDLQKYLYNKENYYYKMFSYMESSVNEANSQMNYLMSF